jgi:TPR repeat protein
VINIHLSSNYLYLYISFAEYPLRNPQFAAEMLKISCDENHGPSCFNLAVLYKHGDTGVEKDEKLFEKYKDLSEKLIVERKQTIMKQFGAK